MFTPLWLLFAIVNNQSVVVHLNDKTSLLTDLSATVFYISNNATGSSLLKLAKKSCFIANCNNSRKLENRVNY